MTAVTEAADRSEFAVGESTNTVYVVNFSGMIAIVKEAGAMPLTPSGGGRRSRRARQFVSACTHLYGYAETASLCESGVTRMSSLLAACIPR